MSPASAASRVFGLATTVIKVRNGKTSPFVFMDYLVGGLCTPETAQTFIIPSSHLGVMSLLLDDG